MWHHTSPLCDDNWCYCYCADIEDEADPVCDCGAPGWACECGEHEVMKKENEDPVRLLISRIVEQMTRMTDEHRLEIIRSFCVHCGGPAGTSCCNDE